MTSHLCTRKLDQPEPLDLFDVCPGCWRAQDERGGQVVAVWFLLAVALAVVAVMVGIVWVVAR